VARRAPAPGTVLGVGLGALAGAGLGLGLGALGVLRRNRPIHTVGTVVPGRLVIDTPGRTGSPLLDTAGATELVARVSRSASWPVALPDVNGLALRIPGGGPDGGPADVLFSSTGTGRFTRYLLWPRVSASAGPLTTMFPLTGRAGNIVLRLDPGPGHRYRLSSSRNSGPWRPLGTVSLQEPEALQRSSRPAGPDDPRLRFHPVARPPAGLAMPAWLRAARAPAYGLARRVWHA
jgi:hypothetical protein